MTESRSWWTRINEGECAVWLIFGKSLAIVCFLLLTDLSVTQTARGTPAGEGLSSFHWVLSLSTLVLVMFTQDGQLETKAWRKDWATWGGEAENRGFNGLCRRSKEDRARKKKKSNSMTEKKKQTNWLIVTAALVVNAKSTRVTATQGSSFCVQQGLGEEPIQRY